MEVQYFTYDFNQKVVIQHKRDGECNGCGKCCQYVIKFSHKQITNRDPRNGGENICIGGVGCAVKINGRTRFFSDVQITDEFKPCGQLTTDNRCRVHLGKTLLSRMWPMSPEQASRFSECSYTFREVQRWTMDEWWGEGWEKPTEERA